MRSLSYDTITAADPVLAVKRDHREAVRIRIAKNGADVISTQLDDGNYLIGQTAFLPDPQAPAPLMASSWSAGYNPNGNQWIRTNPLDTEGFSGVVGMHESDPFSIFPNLAIADFGLGFQFEATIDDGQGGMWEVTTATNGGTSFFTNVATCYPPEPNSIALLLWGLVAVKLRQPRSKEYDELHCLN